jgi:hypothetical protein
MDTTKYDHLYDYLQGIFLTLFILPPNRVSTSASPKHRQVFISTDEDSVNGEGDQYQALRVA